MQFSIKQWLPKLQNYCAYQERCIYDVKTKCKELKLSTDITNELILELLKEKYIDELRYAQSFARGKFNYNDWGKIKITYELKRKEISAYNIKKALLEISNDIYEKKIIYLAEKRLDKNKLKKNHIKIADTIKFIVSKGFESNIVQNLISKIV